MESLSRFLERMGSNFIVASIIPCLAFISSGMVVFKPIIPASLQSLLLGRENPLGQAALLGLLVSVILGFTLTSLNTFILKIFEGYILLQRVPVLKKIEQRRYLAMQKRLYLVREQINRLNNMNSRWAKEKVERFKNKEYEITNSLQMEFSFSLDEILPTRFGNTLKAAESYPRLRYGIDSVPMWPKLIHVIPDSYYQKIDQSLDQLSFLVNCAVLSWLFSAASICAALYQVILSQFSSHNVHRLLYWIPVEKPSNVYLENALVYVFLFLISIFLGIIFNRAARVYVQQYGDMIRSSYDLFKFDLLRKLHLGFPNNSSEEYKLWSELCDFYNQATDKPLQYDHPRNTKS